MKACGAYLYSTKRQTTKMKDGRGTASFNGNPNNKGQVIGQTGFPPRSEHSLTRYGQALTKFKAMC
jgi:hypothetical protein